MTCQATSARLWIFRERGDNMRKAPAPGPGGGSGPAPYRRVGSGAGAALVGQDVTAQRVTPL